MKGAENRDAEMKVKSEVLKQRKTLKDESRAESFIMADYNVKQFRLRGF